MRKAPAVFLMIISLLWNTFAVAQGELAVEHGEGFAHVVLHIENEAHHHEHDGSFHQDQSDESIQHVYADSFANAAGFMPAQAWVGIYGVGSAMRIACASSERDSPVLEGPRRPPRLAA